VLIMLLRWWIIFTVCVSGCAHRSISHPRAASSSPTTLPTTSISDDTMAADTFGLTPQPPSGWKPKPIERDDSSTRQVWVSPTRATAYGIVRFGLPLPVGPGLALPGFIAETGHQQGTTRLISSEAHAASGGVQFVADMPLYRMRGILWTHGFTGWVVYASTERAAPVNDQELVAALHARDATVAAKP